MSIKSDFFERLRTTGLPHDRFVVIGSGVLAAHNIREARDIDLVVDSSLFAELEANGDWQQGRQGGASYALEKGDIEVWKDWSVDNSGYPDYSDLLEVSEAIEGIRFVTLEYLAARKRERGELKDQEDIRRIDEYRNR